MDCIPQTLLVFETSRIAFAVEGVVQNISWKRKFDRVLCFWCTRGWIQSVLWSMVSSEFDDGRRHLHTGNHSTGEGITSPGLKTVAKGVILCGLRTIPSKWIMHQRSTDLFLYIVLRLLSQVHRAAQAPLDFHCPRSSYACWSVAGCWIKQFNNCKTFKERRKEVVDYLQTESAVGLAKQYHKKWSETTWFWSFETCVLLKPSNMFVNVSNNKYNHVWMQCSWIAFDSKVYTTKAINKVCTISLEYTFIRLFFILVFKTKRTDVILDQSLRLSHVTDVEMMVHRDRRYRPFFCWHRKVPKNEHFWTSSALMTGSRRSKNRLKTWFCELYYGHFGEKVCPT